MRTQILSGIAVFALLSFPALAQNAQPGTANRSASRSANRLTSADQTFLHKAAQVNMYEIELGKIAERSSNPAVRQFAQTMVTDHSKMQDQVKSVAMDQGVTLPTKVSSTQQATIDRLSKKSGAAFDKDYIDTMVKDHKTDISEFENQANNASDPAVKSLAEGALPTLHLHLTMAQNVQKKVG
ncbi:MAG TPA: DUF4142 domain-containing protein [Bryobacteraceae bacterium]|nr:DUF4142 domain-containing protein [Bryobacteraceae bacterium]